MARAVGDIDQQWVPDTQLTFTSLASLASSTTLVAGAESAEFVFSSLDNVLNASISGFIKAGTAGTANKVYEIWAVAPINDTPTWPDVFDGTDSAETVTSLNIKNSALKLVAVITLDATTNQVYPFAPVSIRDIFGFLPERVSFFVTQNSGQALNASGHEFTITPVFENVKLS